MTAAVADFRPASSSSSKIKKTDDHDTMSLELTKNPDIIASLRSLPLVKIGFAAETNDHVANATAKLHAKGLDMVVVNDAVEAIGSRFNQATILLPNAAPEALPLMTKEHLATDITGRLANLIASR
jgi:phosphopantothenoylcysteine decarboxylase/phosphopantothenate--cysteine ligase